MRKQPSSRQPLRRPFNFADFVRQKRQGYGAPAGGTYDGGSAPAGYAAPAPAPSSPSYGEGAPSYGGGGQPACRKSNAHS